MDHIIDSVGGFGLYQKVSCALLISSTLMYSASIMETVFTSKSPNFWWQKDGENLTYQELLNRTGVCALRGDDRPAIGRWHYDGDVHTSTIVTQVSLLVWVFFFEFPKCFPNFWNYK